MGGPLDDPTRDDRSPLPARRVAGLFPVPGPGVIAVSEHGRPFVVLSCATSLDGYLDDTSSQRLVLSTANDLDRVDDVRAACDAILVGAGTVRADDPRLLVRSDERRAARVARGLPPSPAKVTVTGTGDLDPAAAFFEAGDADRIVYAARPAVAALRARLGTLAQVVDAGDPVALPALLADLAARGVHRLLVEGGAAMQTAFLGAALVDELHLVVAPFFLGDPAAPRLTGHGRFPAGDARAELLEVRPIDDVVLLRYRLRPADEQVGVLDLDT
jgi:5-amino-6-(5-phosphoribosylamino)uracil reductase